jgi:hypothetical protein
MFNDFEIGTNQEHGIATTSTWWETLIQEDMLETLLFLEIQMIEIKC